MFKGIMAATSMIALLGVSVSAHAAMEVRLKDGYWASASGTADDGAQMCSAYTNGDNFAFMIKFVNHKMGFHLGHTGWQIPKNRQVTVDFNVDGSGGFSWVMAAPTDGDDTLWGDIPDTKRTDGQYWASYIINMLSDGNMVRISFPNGAADSWNLKLDGSQVVLHDFIECVMDQEHVTS